jgi:hypothetical protein
MGGLRLQWHCVCSMFSPLRWRAGAGRCRFRAEPADKTKSRARAAPAPATPARAAGAESGPSRPHREDARRASRRRAAPRSRSSRDTVAAQGSRFGAGMARSGAVPRGLARLPAHQHRYPPGRRLPSRLQPAVSGSDGRRDDAPPADRRGRLRGLVGVCAGRGAAATAACHARFPGSPAVGSAASPCKPIEPPPKRIGARAGGAAEFATP